jgi:hypothetical protein
LGDNDAGKDELVDQAAIPFAAVHTDDVVGNCLFTGNESPAVPLDAPLDISFSDDRVVDDRVVDDRVVDDRVVDDRVVDDRVVDDRVVDDHGCTDDSLNVKEVQSENPQAHPPLVVHSKDLKRKASEELEMCHAEKDPSLFEAEQVICPDVSHCRRQKKPHVGTG